MWLVCACVVIDSNPRNLTTDQEVGGSSPPGRAIYLFRMNGLRVFTKVLSNFCEAFCPTFQGRASGLGLGVLDQVFEALGQAGARVIGYAIDPTGRPRRDGLGLLTGSLDPEPEFAVPLCHPG